MSVLRGRSVARWFAPSFLGLGVAVAWGVLLSGGMRGVVAWALLVSLIPLIGALVFVITGVYAALKRRFTGPMACNLVFAAIAVWPGLWNVGVWRIVYPSSVEKTTPSATVRLPSDAPLRVFWGGDSLENNRHAFVPDQRWAYDLTVEPCLVGSSRLEDYGCWGTPVVAPVSAKVHMAHDGELDGLPGTRRASPKAPFGNFVVLELETKTFLVLAHLQRDSVAVKAGDVVAEGQPIGRCGNSGNTSEPHIHIHHQRQDPAKYPVNFAEGLPLFFRDHNGPSMPKGGVDLEAGHRSPRGDVVKHGG